MRDELAVETIANSFQIGRNHPMIQQRPNSNIFGFEDLFGLGDRDFNDLIASIQFQ